MWISESSDSLLNNDFTNKYYNAGIQFLEVTKCVSAILPQRVNLFEIIAVSYRIYYEASAESKMVIFRVMEKNRGLGYLIYFEFGFRLCYMYLK